LEIEEEYEQFPAVVESSGAAEVVEMVVIGLVVGGGKQI
jgi:hypothetical protein